MTALGGWLRKNNFALAKFSMKIDPHGGYRAAVAESIYPVYAFYSYFFRLAFFNVFISQTLL